ncbi:cadherin EGF LAG seven-pass G-type receptor 2-like [Amphiura filiformis]|uniref:cadherin EGF LAG seven-pass G-type receptor 2-like n=1 Tax=Amphiura filiformis TaxID=82378 RepID=UPI003B21AD30
MSILVSALNYDDTSDGIVYSLKSATNNGLNYFQINPTTGDITVKNDGTDRETTSEYTVIVEAQDRRLDPIRSATANVFVSITDVNEACPEFISTSPSYGEISNHDLYVLDSNTFEPLVLQASDADSIFIGQESLISAIFALDKTVEGNLLYLSIRLVDPDQLTGGQVYQLTITIEDASIVGCSRTIDVEVTAHDSLAPVFDQSDYTASIREGTAQGIGVIKVAATSQNPNPQPGDIYYTLTQGNGVFVIDSGSGQITVQDDGTDYETVKEYTLIVEAQDRGVDPLKSASTTVTVTITDDNDECPYFLVQTYDGEISLEDMYVFEVGTSNRLVLVAEDPDSTFIGDVLILDGNPSNSFVLEQMVDTDMKTNYWYIQLMDPTNVVDDTFYQLLVTVRDPLSLADCSYGLNVTVDIQVENLSPQFTNDIYNGEVDESAPVSTSVATVSAVDKDGDSTYILYRLTNANDNGMDIFGIDEITGVIFVETAGLLDAEVISKYTLYVEADDTKLDVIRSASASVVVSVRDVNDNSPVCSDDSVDIFEDAPIGRPVLAVQASDLDQNDVLSYSLTNLPTDFEIDSNTGLITVSGQLDREPPGPDFYSLQVLVSDGTNIIEYSVYELCKH